MEMSLLPILYEVRVKRVLRGTRDLIPGLRNLAVDVFSGPKALSGVAPGFHLHSYGAVWRLLHVGLDIYSVMRSIIYVYHF